MTSKQQAGQGIELRQTGNNANIVVAEGDRPRTSTAIAREFQYLKQKMENEVQIEKARRTSRMSRGLNPDVPKPVNPPKCKLCSTQTRPKMLRRLRLARWIRRPAKYRRWTNTKSV